MKNSSFKRFISAILLVALVLSLGACNLLEPVGNGSSSAAEEQVPVTTENEGSDLMMVGTARETYAMYIEKHKDEPVVIGDPIEFDLASAKFSPNIDFEPIKDEEPVVAEQTDLTQQDALAQQTAPQQVIAPTETPVLDETYTSVDYEVVPEYAGKTGNIIKWNSTEGKLELSANVPQAGLYSVYLDYYSMDPDARKIELEVYVNGRETFDAAERVNLPRYWHNENDTIEQDVRGNDLNPSQVAYDEWISGAIRDDEGMYDEPYTFSFNAGVNTITIIGNRAKFAISSIRLYNTPKAVSYEEYSNGAAISDGDFYQFIQGETPTYTTDPALHPIYDRSSVNTIPADPVLLKRNTMGGSNWQTQGQAAVYKLDVPAEGWYKIAVRYRQSYARGLKTYRRVYINGVVPFEEANCVTFEYSDYWQTTVIGQIDNNDEPYYFHLNAGINELKIEAISGPTAPLIAELDEMVYDFNYIYRKIIMITGLDPDEYRDYHLESDIPTLLPTFTKLKEECDDLRSRLIDIRGGESSSEVASLTNMSVQLESLIDEPETIPVRLTVFKDNIGALASLIVSLKQEPLELDYLTVTSKGVNEFQEEKGFFENIIYKFKAYLATYVEDYNSVGSNADGEDVLRVWVNLGRDQANLIKEMSDSDFTSQTGIKVKVSLVQQNLIQANIANDGPDVVLFVAGGDVVNLSAREAIVDMTEFKGQTITKPDGSTYKVSSYDEVVSRFSSGSMVQYKYTDKNDHEGYYAMPVTEDFSMLFYRTDIFEELGIEAPKNWTDFYKVLTVLQNNNMQVGIPNGTDTAVDTTVFLSLLKQRGLPVYTDDLKKTTFDNPEALAVFKQWTGFYSQYSMPQRYDFYTRFRTGEMPLGFAGYTFVNQLNYAAPELNGLWEMTPIPGTVQEDGSVDNVVAGYGSGALIYKRAEGRGVKDDAWAYVDWFTSEETQAKYGFDIETLLGAAGRYNTANQAAAERLPWTAKEWKVLKEQWDNMFINPVVIGEYYLGRNLTFAFRNVVIYAKNPREMLLSYNKEINDEITTKRKEFGLEVDE